MFGADVPVVAATERLESFDIERPLNEMEQAFLSVLTTELVSTSVVRDRAHLKYKEVAPEFSRKMLSRTRLIAPVISALEELERRGLAESAQKAKCTRWRLTPEAGKP